MKRMILAIFAATGMAMAQNPQQTPAPSPQASSQAHQSFQTNTSSVGNTPTPYDMYCSGFLTTEKVPEKWYVAGGWNSPDQTRYAAPVDYVYVHGEGMKEGDRLLMLRRVRDLNHYEMFPGQRSAVKASGEPYFELGIVRVIGVQKSTAIAVAELACSDLVPGDLAIPFTERTAPTFHTLSLDRFAAPNGKTVGRIVMAKDFDSFVGSRQIVYLSMGADKGLKPGDYLRATRTYSYTYHQQETGLSLKASTNEDTQKDPQKLPKSEVANLPRRTLGDMIVLDVHQKSATAMIQDALETIQVGDSVELMDVSAAPVAEEIKPAEPAAPAVAASAGSPPTLSCTSSPATVRVGESAIVRCDATSPDNRPLSFTFVSNGGKVSSNRNQATVDTSEASAGPITVRATVFDDRQLSATASATVNVEAKPQAAPAAQKITELTFKPNSAYVDNRSKAILDDVALKLQQDPNSNALLAGAASEGETPKLASQRARNAMNYLTQSKGINANRIQVKTASDQGRKVDVWSLPAGATLPQ